MKKLIFIPALFIALCFLSLKKGYSQEGDRIKNDTLFTKSGYKVVVGETIKLGNGTMPTGDFKFFRVIGPIIPRNNALYRGNSGKAMPVKRIQARPRGDGGYLYYAIIEKGVIIEVDVENAISSGEMIVPSKYSPPSTTTSIPEEIKKYKDLLDSGAITKEEYEAKKKELLTR